MPSLIGVTLKFCFAFVRSKQILKTAQKKSRSNSDNYYEVFAIYAIIMTRMTLGFAGNHNRGQPCQNGRISIKTRALFAS